MSFQVDQYACLQVSAVQSMGAFLEWGQPQNLFLPEREQLDPLSVGQQIIVYITRDRTDRPIATQRLEDYLRHDPSMLRVDQRVSLLIVEQTELGYSAIINHRHVGVLYHSEVFRPLDYGETVTGYVRKIRPDGKVDLILNPTGLRGNDQLGQTILNKLGSSGGFLPITERTPPQDIYEHFGVSKKKFKIALGGLYKKHLVSLEEDGIRLNPT
jgi:predicted RNA-binding protein (virulence factor B family)